jgi:hypothetical protein
VTSINVMVIIFLTSIIIITIIIITHDTFMYSPML